MKRLPITLAGAMLLAGSLGVYAQTEPLIKEPGTATERKPAQGSQEQPQSTGAQGNSSTSREQPATGDTDKQKRDQAGSDGTAQEPKRAQQGGGDGQKGQTQQRQGGKKLEAKQRTVVKETIVKRNVRPANVNFAITVGTVIPRTVILYDVPSTLIEYEPSYGRYKFILADDDTILIVDPETWTIVDVIEI